MGMRVGFHVEGHDDLVLRALLAKVLNLPEEELVPEVLGQSTRGWQQVLEEIPRALHKFYALCAQFVVVGIDNDGNMDFRRTGAAEDPRHPRHWNHEPPFKDDCRYCQVRQVADRERGNLNWLPQKPGAAWPVLIAVPVEMIETWLLLVRAVLDSEAKWLDAEKAARQGQKQALYGRPEATKKDVETVAVPMIRSLDEGLLNRCLTHSSSLRLFVEEVRQVADRINGPRDCYGPGDAAAEVTAPPSC
jgi:hypothetical protein